MEYVERFLCLGGFCFLCFFFGFESGSVSWGNGLNFSEPHFFLFEMGPLIVFFPPHGVNITEEDR